MRKLVSIFVILAVLLGVVGATMALPPKSSGTCADVDTWNSVYSFEAGDVVTATYTTSDNEASGEISLQLLTGGGIDFKTVNGIGVYGFSVTVTVSGDYMVYAGSNGNVHSKGSLGDPSCNSGSAPVVSLIVQGDPDDDGLSGADDNCPNDFNPDQEDGWGSGLGDACDTDWYNKGGIGVNGYAGNDGTYRVFGNCYTLPDGDVRCLDVGQFDPNELNPGNAPQDVTSENAEGWRVVVYYLHSNHGYPVYQVNTYDENNVLVDDRLEIHVFGEGNWQWFNRGGASQYNGI